MTLPVITQLNALIALFKAHGEQLAQVAASVAVAAAESDPKVQSVTEASAALLAAAQGLKAAMKAAPAAVPPPAQ